MEYKKAIKKAGSYLLSASMMFTSLFTNFSWADVNAETNANIVNDSSSVTENDVSSVTGSDLVTDNVPVLSSFNIRNTEEEEQSEIYRYSIKTGEESVSLRDILISSGFLKEEDVDGYLGSLKEVAVGEDSALTVETGEEHSWYIRAAEHFDGEELVLLKDENDIESHITITDKTVQPTVSFLIDQDGSLHTGSVSLKAEEGFSDDIEVYAENAYSWEAENAVKNSTPIYADYSTFNIGTNEEKTGYDISMIFPTPLEGKEYRLFHVNGTEVQELEGNITIIDIDETEKAAEAQFHSDSLGTFVVACTKEYEYWIEDKDYYYSITDSESIPLRDVLVGSWFISEEYADLFTTYIQSVESSNPEVLEVASDNEAAVLIPHDRFESVSITVTMKDWQSGVITITDERQSLLKDAAVTSPEDEEIDLITISATEDQLPEEAESRAEVVSDDSEIIAAVEEHTEETGSASEKVEYKVFDIGLDHVDTDDYESFDVELKLSENAALTGKNFKLYHILNDGTIEEIDLDVVSTEDENGNEVVETLTFTTPSFSKFVLVYTVDFHWGDYTYSIAGASKVLLSTLLYNLGTGISETLPEDSVKLLVLSANMSQIENVTFSNEELVKVEQQENNDWLLTSLSAFNTEETLTITLTDGSVIAIRVTDETAVYVCKITDAASDSGDSDNLLYYNAGTASNPKYQSAVFTALKDAVEKLGALYSYNGSSYQSYGSSATKIKMLVESYEITSQISIGAYTTTLTTAGTNDTDGYPYSGSTAPATIIASKTLNRMFNLDNDSTDLTLTNIILDGNSNGGRSSGSYGALINMEAGKTAKLTLNDGTVLQNSKCTVQGAAIDNHHGTLIMNEGVVIRNCSTSTYGGAVHLYDSTANFTMNGGTIDNCDAAGDGGGAVYLYGDSAFTMNGGTISNCDATGTNGKGGGICVSHSSATFTMNGGTITNCTAGRTTYYAGGGVCVDDGNFIMNDGTISNCSATGSGTGSDHSGGAGGAIAINHYETATIKGGTIENCTAVKSGGAIEIHGTLNMSGGTITGCSSTYGGAVGFYSGGTGTGDGLLNLSGNPVIYNNNSLSGKQRNVDLVRLDVAATSTTILNKITVTGVLDSSAKVGVYAPEANKDENENFGKYNSGVSTSTFNIFKNDIETMLVGAASTSGTNLMWSLGSLKVEIYEYTKGSFSSAVLKNEGIYTPTDDFISMQEIATSLGYTASEGYKYDTTYINNEIRDLASISSSGYKVEGYDVAQTTPAVKGSTLKIYYYYSDDLIPLIVQKTWTGVSSAKKPESISFTVKGVLSGDSASSETINAYTYNSVSSSQVTTVTGDTTSDTWTQLVYVPKCSSNGTEFDSYEIVEGDISVEGGMIAATYDYTNTLQSWQSVASENYRTAYLQMECSAKYDQYDAVRAYDIYFKDIDGVIYRSEFYISGNALDMSVVDKYYYFPLLVPNNIDLESIILLEGDNHTVYTDDNVPENTYALRAFKDNGSGGVTQTGLPRFKYTNRIDNPNAQINVYTYTEVEIMESLPSGVSAISVEKQKLDVFDRKEVTANNAFAICKITDIDDSEEHTFATLNDALTYAREYGNGQAMSSSNPVTIEMLADYTIPADDALTLDKDTDNIIITTAATSGGTYNFVDTLDNKDEDEKGIAILKRGYSGGSLFTINNGNASLTTKNIIVDGGATFDSETDAVASDSLTSTGKGGIVCLNENGSTLNIYEGTTLRNTVAKEGGAIYTENAVTININDATFNHCYAKDSTSDTSPSTSNGGAIKTDDIGATITITGASSFTSCQAVGYQIVDDSYGSGGAIYTIGNITVTGTESKSVVFKDCSAKRNGGAICTDNNDSTNGSVMQLKYCSFISCKTVGTDGGAVFSSSKTLTMEHCTFSECVAGWTGGAMFIQNGNQEAVNATLKNNTISSCSAAHGGGIYIDTGNVSMTGDSIYSCSATNETDGNGGGVYVNKDSLFNMTDGIISSCSATNGGGLYVESESGETTSKMYIKGNSSITNNTATYGGGIYAYNEGTEESNDTLIITITDNTSISYNYAQYGGGVHVAVGDVTLEGKTGGTPKITNNGVSGENTTVSGGGVYVYTGATFTMTGTGQEVSENKASVSGGGIFYSNDSPFTMGSNSEITGNVITGSGEDCKGAGVYLGGSAWILMSGDLTFNDNYIEKDDSYSYINGGQTITGKIYQDIYASAADNEPAIIVTDVLTSTDGQIWVWAEKDTQYELGKTFANYTLSDTVTESEKTSSFAVFRNARGDTTTKNTNASYLRGVDAEGTANNTGSIKWGCDNCYICKIVDTNSADGTRIGETEKYEHPFATLNDALTYARNTLSGTATIEMLVDYTVPETDKATLNNSNDNITITTAATSGGIYNFTDTLVGKDEADKGTAMLIRGWKNESVGNALFNSLDDNSVSLTTANIIFDGNGYNGRAIHFGGNDNKGKGTITIAGNTSFRNFTLDNSSSGAAVLFDANATNNLKKGGNGTVKLAAKQGETITFSDITNGCAVTVFGADIDINNAGIIKFENCTGSGDTAALRTNVGYGYKITIDNSGTLSFDTCKSPTSSKEGGAIRTYMLTADNRGTIKFNNCANNSTTSGKGNGGAIWVGGTTTTGPNNPSDNDTVLRLRNSGNGTITFNGCTSGNDSGGAIYITARKAEISGGTTTFTNCTATSGSGGAIYSASGTVTVEDSSFNTCTAKAGGGIYAANGAVTLKNSTLATCTATNGNGGGVYALKFLTVDHSGTISFSNCTAESGNGGAIYISNSSNSAESFKLVNTDADTDAGTVAGTAEFNGCKAKAGGAVYVTNGKMTLTGGVTSFTNCHATAGGGGAIWQEDGVSMTISNVTCGALDASKNVIEDSACTATGGTARNDNRNIRGIGGGGGIGENSVKTVSLSNCNFYGCKALGEGTSSSVPIGRGGGVYFIHEGEDSKVSLTNSNFVGCTAQMHGGGAVVGGKAGAIISNCTFTNCLAGTGNGDAGYGGGMLTQSAVSSVNMTNTTFKGCSGTHGGGWYIDSSTSTVTLKDVTFGSLDENGNAVDADACTASKNNGGAIYSKAKTNNIYGLKIYGCKATATDTSVGLGSGLYLATTDASMTLADYDDNESTKQSVITGCTASGTNGGAINVASRSKVYFGGNTVVYNNTYDSDSSQRNMVLEEDSNAVIYTTANGLEENAHIGVYVVGDSSNNPYKEHGTHGLPFGTWTAENGKNNLEKFTNDRIDSLYGVYSEVDKLIYWGPYICKIVDINSTAHRFINLKDAVAFAEGTDNQSLLTAYKTATIEMLVDYEMPSTDAVTIASEDTITLTTASRTVAEGDYPYTGEGDYATITRAYTGTSMFTNPGTFTLTGIIIDGGYTTETGKTSYSATFNGGIVTTSGTLNIGENTTLQNSYTTMNGAAIYALDGAIVNFDGRNESTIGVNITGNTATQGGAIDVGGTKARLYFNGNVVVYDNLNTDKQQKNVVLDYNDNSVIQTTGIADGLGVNAKVGIYTTDKVLSQSSGTTVYTEHGKKDKPFGTCEPGVEKAEAYSDVNLDHFYNDRDNTLRGVRNHHNQLIYWDAYICKVTDGNDHILYKDSDCKQPAIYNLLGNTRNSDGAFSVVRPGVLYSGVNELYYGKDYKIKMLVDYTLPDTQGVNVLKSDIAEYNSGLRDCNLTLTTSEAPSKKIDNYPYIGNTYADGIPTAVINAGIFTNDKGQIITRQAMFVMGNNADTQYTGTLTLTNITIDGNATLNLADGTFSGQVCGDHGALVSVRGNTTLNITEGTTLRNGWSKNGGGAICVWGTCNMYDGSIIQNCFAAGGDGGGAVYIHSAGKQVFNMYGGTIENCYAQKGGAVAINGNAFNFYGGTIKNCVATTDNGGGAVFQGRGTFNFGSKNTDGTYSGTGIITNCFAKYGGGIRQNGGTTNYYAGTVQNCAASINGGGIFVDGGAVLILQGNDKSVIKANTAVNAGAGIYLARKITSSTTTNKDTGEKTTTYKTSYGILKISGNPVFGSGDDANTVTISDYSSKKNGGESSYTENKARQDIYLAEIGTESSAESAYTPASIVVTGDITSGDGSIWVWAENQYRYKQTMPFAVMANGITFEEADSDGNVSSGKYDAAHLKAFRNAQDDETTENGTDTYLYGTVEGEVLDKGIIYWTGISGYNHVMLRKVASETTGYSPVSGKTLTIYKGSSTTAYTPKDVTTPLSGLESNSSGIFWIGDLPYGTYIIEETDPHRFFYLIVDKTGNYGSDVAGGYDTREAAEAAAKTKSDSLKAS